jgi:glycosyltransferase involved in cell wall biosynthesis
MNFHLYSPLSLTPWNPEDTETGIGGIETSVAEMAWRLQRAGHDVTVYAPTGRPKAVWRGTTWIPIDQADFSLPGIWCLYRCPGTVKKFDRSRQDQKIWFMVQDWDYGWSALDSYDRAMVLCETHKKWLIERHPELEPKITVTSNGVKVDLIDELCDPDQQRRCTPCPPRRNPKKIIFASSPDRGLMNLLHIVAYAQKQVPDLELHVFYGFNGIESFTDNPAAHSAMLQLKWDIIEYASRIPNVKLRGRVTQTELYREWLSAGIFCYPSTFAELSFIAGQEAQCMGAIPVVTPVWAQGENVRHGYHVPGNPDTQDVKRLFASQIIGLAKDPELQDRIRAEMMPESRERCNWDRYVDQWIRLAEEDMQYREVRKCLGCGGKHLETVLDLGEQALAGAFPKPGETVMAAPLKLQRCMSCDLGQLSHAVDRKLLFGGEYGYRSGINEAMRRHLEGLASSTLHNPGDLILDIGANDGTLLDAFPDHVTKVGFEPSDLCLPQYHKEFFSAEAFKRLYPGRQANVVFTLAMFYDLEDPLSFAREVYEVLAEDGTWVIELQDFAATLDIGAYDTVLHEHLTYWDMQQLNDLLSQAGFKVDHAMQTSTNGYSLLIHAKKGWRVARQASVCKDWRAFRIRAEGARDNLRTQIQSLKGRVIMGYGSSTKGNVLLQYCGFSDEDIIAIADRNPDKWGRVTPGTGIPIISEMEMRAISPDYLLALPWAFIDGFRKREPWARFITPFPEPKIWEPLAEEVSVDK